MSILGRGLASLIPKQNPDDASELIERIDSMEEVQGAKKTGAKKPIRAQKTEPAASKRVSIVEESDEGVVDAPVASQPKNTDTHATITTESTTITLEVAGLDDFEELHEMETAPMPQKPLVTPLQLDPDTGTLQQAEVTMSQTVEEVELEAVPEVVAAEPEAAVTSTRHKIENEVWETHEERVELVPVVDIEVNPFQPRRTFNPEELEELTQSLQQHGILQPLVVMRKANNMFELVAGERRLRAARKLGWDKVPCVVRTDVHSDRGSLELALIENIQRENLNPVEEAMGYKRLNEEYGMSHEEIGQRVGKSRVGITNIIRILQLPAEIQQGLIEGKITIGHARAILMIPDEDKQLRFYKHMIEEGLTVRKAETRARRIQRQMKLNDPMRMKRRGRPELALKYDGLLEEKFGHQARVKFSENKNRFEVMFYAFSESEAEELIARLLAQKEAMQYPEDEE